MDLLDRASVEQAAAAATGIWGRLDILVNNAIYQGTGPMERLRDLSIDDAETTIRADYLHPLLPVSYTHLGGARGSTVIGPRALHPPR